MPVRCLMPFLLFLFSRFTVPAQNIEPGFYLTQKVKQSECERSIRLSDKKNDVACLTQKPIIPTEKFVAVSKVMVNHAASLEYVDLTVSEDAVSVLKALSSALRGSTMVLILNGSLVGILDYNETQYIRNNQIRISVKLNSGRIDNIHNQLTEIIAMNKKQSSAE